MNHAVRRTLTALFLAVVSFAGAAHAQSSRHTIKAHIPFEFNVGDKTFPAGDYSIVQPLENDRNMMALQDDNGVTIASMLTNDVWSANPPASPVLKFYVSNGQRRLAEVWRSENGSYGHELVTSKARVPFDKRRTDDTDAIVAGSKP